jgi:hypothetical protein
MKTFIMLRLTGGENPFQHIFVREVSNSFPEGATVEEAFGGSFFQFIVDHVHVRLGSQDIRILCLIPRNTDDIRPSLYKRHPGGWIRYDEAGFAVQTAAHGARFGWDWAIDLRKGS